MAKIVIDKKTATKIEKVAKLVIDKNNTLPILDNVLVKDGHIIVSDLENEVHIKTNINQNFCVDSKQFCKIISNFPEFEIAVRHDVEKVEFSNTDSKGKIEKFTQQLYRSDEFPNTLSKKLSDIPSYQVGTLTNEDVGKIRTSLLFLGSDDLRPVMTTTLIGNGVIAATDAHILYFDKLSFDTKHCFMLNKKVIKLICELNSEKDPLRITAHYNSQKTEGFNELIGLIDYYVTIENSDYKIISKGCVGKFPNYEAVIPKENPNKITFDKKELKSVFPKLYLAINKSTNQFSIKYYKGVVSLFAEDIDFSNEYKKEVEAISEFSDENFEIAFNLKLLEKIVNECIEEKITIEMSLPNRAGIINGRFLIMPLMLKH